MTSESGKQIVTTQILPNISRSNDNQEIWSVKGTVMQIEKAQIAFVFQKYLENFAFQLFIIFQ